MLALIFSAVVIEEAFRLPQPKHTFEPGVGFLPFWLGVLMAILSVVLIVDARRRPVDLFKNKLFPGKKALYDIALILASLAAYILFLEVLGFIIDTILVNIFLLSFVMRERWKRAIMVASVTSAGLYLIFQVLLNVPLPKNYFGF